MLRSVGLVFRPYLIKDGLIRSTSHMVMLVGMTCMVAFSRLLVAFRS